METYRVRLDTAQDEGVFVPFLFKQEFDTLEMLSLKVNQNEFYRRANSNYGVLVGRVAINDGFGVPNAKVSVFIERDENESSQITNELYPYNSVYDLDSDGIRYNLLPRSRENSKDPCYQPVGTFPTKNEMLDNPEYMEVFEKYYKLTATTNSAGDYFIMGVPLGNQVVHVDIDLSDIGFFSIKPYDFIAQGMDENLFASNTKFKTSKNLDRLVHVYGYNKSVNVRPFWGQDGQVGITQLNINLPINITPTAIVSFGTFTDAKSLSISRNCRARRKQGRNCQLEAGNGTAEIIRRVSMDSNEIEYISTKNFQIDDNGAAVIPVPLNLSKKITDEFGNLIDSVDGSGIPTEAKIRMKVSLSEFENGSRVRTAKYLIPNLYNDFTFDETTADEDMYTLSIKNLYTVMNYIPRIQRNKSDGEERHTGFKRIEECESNNAIPFNRISRNFNILYSIICLIIGILTAIAIAINVLVGVINTIIDAINTLPIPGAIPNINGIELQCNDESSPPNEWQECVISNIAEQLGVIDKKFFNDFLVGSLYFPKFKFKVRFKRRKDALYYKYCAYNCRDFVGSSDPDWINRCKDTHIVDENSADSSPSYFDSGQATETISPATDGRGMIYQENAEFYYVARNDVEANSGHVDLDLDAEGIMQKDKLMWATNFMPMGSVVECSASPYIIDRLEATTFQEDEVQGFLYDSNDLGDCFLPSGLQEDRIYRICEYGVDVFNEQDDDISSVDYALDSEEIDVREYLCSNFSLYNNVYTHNIVSTTPLVDDDGNSFDIVVDECQNCTTNKPIRNISPYFHYWGLIKGKTALDKLKKDYVGNCE